MKDPPPSSTSSSSNSGGAASINKVIFKNNNNIILYFIELMPVQYVFTNNIRSRTSVASNLLCTHIQSYSFSS